MPVAPERCLLYFPAERTGAKREFLEALGATMRGWTTDPDELGGLSRDIIPVVGCYPEIAGLIGEWQVTGRPFLYRDNGYFGRATSAAFGHVRGIGHYRWHWCRTQLGEIEAVPDDRFAKLRVPIRPWRSRGKHIVVALPSVSYNEFHGLEGWAEATRKAIVKASDRPIRFRHKGARGLVDDLRNAHCLVTHGSVAAVESVALGVPVFVDPVSAAALVGRTDLAKIEKPVMPQRRAWLAALAYSQFSEREMLDGTIWGLLPDPPC